MLENIPNDLKTRALVLRRTNYGEADRILNLITPVGKISAMAKGVRKPRAKLAGAVEMFTLTEVNLHFGRGSNSSLATLTGAKMVRFYGGILKDLVRMEMATELIRKINQVAENVDNSEHFTILDECLFALNDGENPTMVEAWFLLNLARSVGEQVNLMTDIDGAPLQADEQYGWDFGEMVFFRKIDGVYDANAIKLMRLMWATDLKTVRRVKGASEYMPEILKIAQAVNKVVK